MGVLVALVLAALVLAALVLVATAFGVFDGVPGVGIGRVVEWVTGRSMYETFVHGA